MANLGFGLALALMVTGGLLAGPHRPATAHEGHDHGAPLPPVTKTIAPRADASSDDFEVVIVARGDALVVHVDTFRTNEPVTGAEIEIDTPAGILKPVPVEKEAGSYRVPASFAALSGSYDLAITINAGGTIDILAATLRIPALEQDAPAAVNFVGWLMDPAVAQEVRNRVVAGTGSGVIFALAGFLAGMVLTRLLWPRRLQSAAPHPEGSSAVVGVVLVLSIVAALPSTGLADGALAHAGRDIAQRFPDGAVFVPKPTQRILGIRTQFVELRDHHRVVRLPGRIIPSPNASGLVQASVGGRLQPPQGGFKPLGREVKRGEILAYVQPPLDLADATAQQQLSRELDQQISIVARRLERLRVIERVVAKSQIEEAELELRGLRIRRANLERVGAEPEALVAPVAGVLAAANAVAGQMAEPNAVIFQIIDPAHLWIEALSYEAQQIEGQAQAVLSRGRTIVLEHVGSGFADRNQAVPIHFAIKGETVGLRMGQLVTVLAVTEHRWRGTAVPREAVLRGANGQALVYEHTNAERFVPREVRVEPLDGTNVLVVAGIEPARRIVTKGAELLNQIR